MKVTKSQLRRIIREELEKVLDEGGFVQRMQPAPASQRGPRPAGLPQTPEEAEATILDPEQEFEKETYSTPTHRFAERPAGLTPGEYDAVQTLGEKFQLKTEDILNVLGELSNKMLGALPRGPDLHLEEHADANNKIQT